MPSRREILKMGAVALALDQLSSAQWTFEDPALADLQTALAASQITSERLVEIYAERIQKIDKSGPRVNAVIEMNPDAPAIAAALDRERKEKGPRGPLHGIPILIKDNIDTGDKMMTSAGSLALASRALKDAALVERLRAAGAIVLGKTNLSEWANFRSTHSTSGWSGRGGQTRNPYALDRNPSGSSSGTAAAVAANLCAAGVGTETDGSIVSPSSINGIVGIKPTVGLIPGAGIVPVSRRQDTAGPMARTVADAALLLEALAGASYGQALDPGGLRGARLGIARQIFGFNDRVDRLMQSAIDTMKQLGAEIVDPAMIPTYSRIGELENEAMLYEFKADLNAYLEARGGPVKSLQEVIAFNEKNRDREMPWFGQDQMLKAQEKGPVTSKAYRDLVSRLNRLARQEGIDSAMTRLALDALVAPTDGPAWLTDYVLGDHFTGGSSMPAAVAGYPHVTVPAGYVFGLPVGISFFGSARSEVKLIKYAFAFEQATKARKPPSFAPSAKL
ncbi:MAG TPA: amidase [Bryobacteraceae bacterium]|jgi:amidase|nr:amidase [Bryobacteraceae bacterium]